MDWRRFVPRVPPGRRHGALALAALVVTGPLPTVLAQGPGASAPVLVSGMVAAGGGTEGFAGALGLDVMVETHLLSARAVGVAGILDDEFWDVGVLYGRAVRWSRGWAAASAGVALMDGLLCSGLGGCSSLARRVSLPLAARATWQVLPAIGIGAYGFANINDRRSFAGLTLAVLVGRVR